MLAQATTMKFKLSGDAFFDMYEYLQRPFTIDLHTEPAGISTEINAFKTISHNYSPRVDQLYRQEMLTHNHLHTLNTDTHTQSSYATYADPRNHSNFRDKLNGRKVCRSYL